MPTAMYVTTARTPHPAGRSQVRAESATKPLSLRLATHTVARETRAFSHHDHDFFTDLFRDFGLCLDQGAFDAGRTSFTDLVAELLPRLGGYEHGFDLALLASATSDAEPGWPMCFLTQAVRDPGLVLGIADQGVLAPFTALRLATDRAEPGQATRVLLFVLDQHSVLHGEPVPERLRAQESAGAVVVLEAKGDPGRVSAPVVRAVEPAEVPQQWDAMVAAAESVPGAAGPLTTVVGPELAARTAGHPQAVERLAAPLGLPCSGIWALLAERLPTWRRAGRRVLLADHDPDLGRLAGCVIDIEPESGEEPGV
ncbi:hypothetical protein [Streptomyces sp. NPDC051684]|uniref:hypothetical protein n=1 Tax=Streptomyces sp. NPDC051684 TaxID=3365670 RepID=UPI003793F255